MTPASARSLPRRLGSPALLLELFVTVNFAVLVADAWLAHSFNDFAEPVEWVSVGFAALAAAALGANLLAARPRSGGSGREFLEGGGRLTGLVVGALAVLVGVSGLVFHLEGSFFQERTLQSLVYAAPFVAPLAYAGLGFLLLLNRMVPAGERAWSAWVLVLACGGFFGNFLLALADHAQNGFFHATEWIPVVVAALVTGWLVAVLVRPPERSLLRWGFGLLVIAALTGVAGVLLHLTPIMEAEGRPIAERLIYGAPIFAPMLFPNLALLAAIGLWSTGEAFESGAGSPLRALS